MPTVSETLEERRSCYGDFSNHAELAQRLITSLQHYCPERRDYPWDDLTPVQRQALTVICDKIARILNGDPNYLDNWHDIQGYARLVEERLPKSSFGQEGKE